jgi:hypothetical protein
LCSAGTAGSLNCTGHGASTAPRSGKSIRTDPPSICLASCLFNRHTTHLHISGCVSNFHLVASLLLRVPGLRCARDLQFSEDRTVPAFSVWNEDQRILNAPRPGLRRWVALASRRIFFFFLARLEHVRWQALCWSDRKTSLFVLFKNKQNQKKIDGKTGLSKDVFPGLGSLVKVCLRFSYLCEKVKA